MKKYLLEVAVFLCGAVLMIFEIVGSRVVAPYFGTSIYVWTSLIGVILASLSAGYWLGGRIADKNPSFKGLSRIILASAIFIILATILKGYVLAYLSQVFSDMIMRTLLAAIILFAPASIFLGMVSPYAIRLKLKTISSSGKTVGNLYAISTVGSILGTFLVGFVLIPFAGTTNILYIIAGTLVAVAFSLGFKFFSKGDFILTILVLAVSGYDIYLLHTSEKQIIEVDTRYNHVQIFERNYWINGAPIKVMKVNDEYSSAMFPDNDSLVYEYTWFYQLAEHFKPGFYKTLLIGGAAYSYPKYYLSKYPEASIDVVEIDPGLTDLARKHFRLVDNPRLRIFHEDGRTFLNNSPERYDVILGDAFKSLMSIPFQLTTLEAARRKYDMLEQDGIVIVNIIASMEGPASEFLYSEYVTYREVFPQVYIFACHDPEDPGMVQSISLIALKSTSVPSFYNADPLLNNFLSHKVNPEISPEAMILTDDYAPVEYFTRKAL